LLTLSLLSEPYQKLFSNPRSQNRALSFSSKLLLHLSYNKNGVSGSFTFHKSKLHIIYINLLPNSDLIRIMLSLQQHVLLTPAVAALDTAAFGRPLICFRLMQDLMFNAISTAGWSGSMRGSPPTGGAPSQHHRGRLGLPGPEERKGQVICCSDDDRP